MIVKKERSECRIDLSRNRPRGCILYFVVKNKSSRLEEMRPGTHNPLHYFRWAKVSVSVTRQWGYGSKKLFDKIYEVTVEIPTKQHQRSCWTRRLKSI